MMWLPLKFDWFGMAHEDVVEGILNAAVEGDESCVELVVEFKQKCVLLECHDVCYPKSASTRSSNARLASVPEAT